MRGMNRVALRSSVSLVVVALCALGFFALRTHRAPKAAAPAAQSWRFAWSPGHSYVYALEAHTKQHARFGDAAKAQAIDGEMTIDGELLVRCHAAENGRFTLGVSVQNLTTASLVVGGAEGLADRAAIDRKEALVEIDARGRVGRVLFHKDDAATFTFVMQSLIGLLQVTLPEGPAREWEIEEPTLLGRAHARYAVEAPNVMHRVHSAYTVLMAAPDAASVAGARIDSDDRASLALDGALDALRVSEHVVVPSPAGPKLVADVALDLSRKGEGTFVPVPIALDALDAHRLNEVASTADVRRAILENVAAQTTPQQIDDVVAAYGHGAALPPGFLTSAAALIKLRPETAGALVEIFERPETSGMMRALLCDILVSAGTREAQAALRDVIASDAARSDAVIYPQLVQRLGLVLAPEKATVDMTLKEYARASAVPVRTASAYALGSAIGARARAAGRGEVVEYNKRLRQDLANARRDEDRVTLLAALGNAGLPENVALVRGYAKDKSAAVRKQTAIALRKTDREDAHETLMELLSDDEAAVGLASIGALANQEMTPARMKELASFASSRAHAGELNEALLTVVGAHPELGEDAILALRAILASTEDPHTRARARMLLEQLGAKG
jgi:HEAT repeat protein